MDLGKSKSHTIHQGVQSLTLLSLIFFAYGFFIDFKPSEPFLVPYLIKVKGFTNDEIEEKIFPLWTYAYFVAVVFCGLLSEVFQYKPVLILGSFARVATRIILLFGTTLLAMQATQLTFGLACGSEVLFYAYVYYLVPYSQYQKLTGITRSSVLIGHVGANLLGQLLVTKFHSPLIVLFYISLGTIIIATIISLFFPAVTIELKSCSQNFSNMKASFLDIVANKETLPWAGWYFFALASNDMVLNYATTLFYDVDPSVDWNGAVMAVVRLAGAAGAVIPSIHWIDSRMETSRIPVVVILTLIGGVCMILAAFVNIWVVFALFVIYMASISFCISVSAAQIAKSMSTRKYALVFSVITIAYLGLESLAQLIIGTALHLSSRAMFCVFGSMIITAAIVFAILACAFRGRKNTHAQKNTHARTQTHAQTHQQYSLIPSAEAGGDNMSIND